MLAICKSAVDHLYITNAWYHWTRLFYVLFCFAYLPRPSAQWNKTRTALALMTHRKSNCEWKPLQLKLWINVGKSPFRRKLIISKFVFICNKYLKTLILPREAATSLLNKTNNLRLASTSYRSIYVKNGHFPLLMISNLQYWRLKLSN